MTVSQVFLAFVAAGISTGAAWAGVNKALTALASWAESRKTKAKGEAKTSTVNAEAHKLEAQAEAQAEETTGKVVAYAVKAAEREAAAAEATDLALQNERMVRLGLEARRDAQDKAIDKLRAECEERDRACQERDRLCMERDAVQDRELAVQAEKIRHLEQMGAQLLARWKDTPR